MLIIRLQRVGKRNQPMFRLAISDSRRAVKGKTNEVLGWYNPRSKEGKFENERILHWISKGAQCSDSAWNLLVRKGVIKGKKRKIKISIKKSKESPAVQEAKAPVAA